ncbi:hypothetical protein BN1195_03511 [Chryseobacterium oranimense G311]|uniref:hypothetical protein n=1 Tax=Chryseobacterium oranimense TaxID=421058 RepID=UPI000533A6F5|nr:hypothetical protein [Chryseobacterium oranimense]CEJ71167.1 hypothetical protein BN1195_03511 [Chryseobacterium oranimense G311]
MKKNLSVRLLFGAALVASLASCRSEDFLNSHEEAPPSKFRVFTAQKDETINYGKGFKTLLEHYDDIHKVQHTAQAVRNALKKSLETTGEYVEMNIRSQDFTTKTNEKFTLFPLIKNQQVDGIIIAVLKENETQVEFLKMYPEAENYSEMLKLFREAYLKNTLPQRLAAKANGSCSSDGTPCDTGEVIITMPGSGGGYTGGTWNGDTLPAGGCLPYDNCLNPEGGGGEGGGQGPEPASPNQDIINELKDYPCAQDLVKQLPDLKNDIAVAMKGIFNNNKDYNIIFKAKSGLGIVDGTTFSSFSTEFGTFKATINLNDDVLRNATKEYILVTMYHEVIHAYLDYEKFKLGDTAFQEQYPSVVVGYDYAADGTMVNRYTFIEGHQQLGAFLTTLQNIVSNYNPSLPTETVKAIAKAGITTMTITERELNQNERDTSLGKQKGTKCP